VICPYCEKDGKQSLLYVVKGHSEMAQFFPFYDEAGAYHAHDPNLHSTHYECSNSHHFITRAIRRCPSCRYGWDKEPALERIG